MTKNLSGLQKEILKLAYENRINDSGHIVDVSTREVLISYYGFEPIADLDKPLVFSREMVGIRKYQSASISVCKAFNRLVARGLAKRIYNQGIVLTQQGIETARALI